MKAKMKNKNSYIYSYTRTAIGAFQGSLKSISATELGSKVIYSLINKIDLNDGLINEVIMGNVLSADLGQAPARQAALGAGLSNNVECLTINKVCGSGLKSVMLADDSIRLGKSDVIVGGGMENMSLAPYYMSKSRTGFGFGHQNITDSILKDGLWDPYNNTAMGNCAEILCKEESYSREKQDDFAIESYKRSNHAISEGLFESEITPIVIKHKKNEVIFKIDEEPLKFNEKKINQLRPAFNKEGTITAANASSLSDGAAAVLLGSKDLMDSNKYKPIAKIIAHTSFATEPIYFTKAPIFAIKKVLNMADMKIEQIDLFEINEAFSCVPMVAIDSLNIPISKVNIHGGSVSMGHPIGASGTRILVTLINALKLKKLKYGIASICIGGGEASAMIIENCEIS
jgi:acetyl-CoA C-acetyltransferase